MKEGRGDRYDFLLKGGGRTNYPPDGGPKKVLETPPEIKPAFLTARRLTVHEKAHLDVYRVMRSTTGGRDGYEGDYDAPPVEKDKKS